MIDNFRTNTCVSHEYRYPSLNELAKNHPGTWQFEAKMRARFLQLFKAKKGMIEDIEPGRDFVMLKGPKFNEPRDILISGLSIAVHDVWAWKVELLKFEPGRRTYSMKYRVTLYDHFGLNRSDVEKVFGHMEGFRAWFILQHLKRFSYKPYITVMEFDRESQGRIPQ